MVEILKRGTLPEERVHTVDCTNCHSKLRFKEKEATKNTTGLFITCPVCTKTVWKAFPSVSYGGGGGYFDR